MKFMDDFAVNEIFSAKYRQLSYPNVLKDPVNVSVRTFAVEAYMSARQHNSLNSEDELKKQLYSFVERTWGKSEVPVARRSISMLLK